MDRQLAKMDTLASDSDKSIWQGRSETAQHLVDGAGLSVVGGASGRSVALAGNGMQPNVDDR